MTRKEANKNDLGVDREDAVERLNALKQFIGYDKHSEMVKATQKSLDMAIKALEQEPKIGHWIKSQDCYGNNHFTCPFCGHDIATKADIWDDNYCSNCGCRMVEPQESEG